MTDEDILNKILNKSGRLNPYSYKKLTEEEIKYIKNRFIDGIDSLKEGLYRLAHNTEEKPKCEICGKYLKYNGGDYGSRTCSKECGNKLRDKNSRKSKLEKYGHEYYSNWEKSKRTCLERYGTTNWFQSKESKQRMKEKYGVEYGLQSKNIWKKTREATIEKYGCAYNKEQLNKTLLEKYGVKWFTQSNKLIKATHSEEAEHKRYLTRKETGIYKSSKEELKTDEILRKIFPDLIHIYKDKERYPFECDFYIPSLDLFIECQYHWTHGYHPYDSNNKEDIEKVEYWKNRNTKYFDIAIDVWTNRDVKKRNTARENNLNWIEFFNINEVKEWLNNFEIS